MKDPVILPVRPGTISPGDKAKLSKAGVIVIEHESPSEVRLIRPGAEVDASDMLRCAMRAIKAGGDVTTKMAFADAFASIVVGTVPK